VTAILVLSAGDDLQRFGGDGQGAFGSAYEFLLKQLVFAVADSPR